MSVSMQYENLHTILYNLFLSFCVLPTMSTLITFLPHAYVVRRQVKFSQVCVCSIFGAGGVPHPRYGPEGGGLPIPGLDGAGEYPIPGLDGAGGYPIPGLDGGRLYPLATTRWSTPLEKTEWVTPWPGPDGEPPRPELDGVTPPPH